MNSPCSPAPTGRDLRFDKLRTGRNAPTSYRVSRRLVILADEVECGQIRIHPALQAAGNSYLNWGHMVP
jgi:hypothetical protein